MGKILAEFINVLLSEFVSGVSVDNINSLINHINRPRAHAARLRIENPLDSESIKKLVAEFGRSADFVLKRLSSKVLPNRTLAQVLSRVISAEASRDMVKVSEAIPFFEYGVPQIDTQSRGAVDKLFESADRFNSLSPFEQAYGENDFLENTHPGMSTSDFMDDSHERDTSIKFDANHAQAVLGILFKTVDSFCDLFRKGFLKMDNADQDEVLEADLKKGLDKFHQAIDLILTNLNIRVIESLEAAYSRMHGFFFAIDPAELIASYKKED